MNRLLLNILLLGILAASLVAPASTVSPANNDTSTLSNPLSVSVATGTENKGTGLLLEERVHPVLRDPSQIAQYFSEANTLLRSTYKTLFGVDIGSNPVGLLVKLGNMSLAQLRTLATDYGGVLAKYWRPIDTALIVLPGDNPKLIAELARQLALTGAEYVLPDRIHQPLMWDAAYLLGMADIWSSLGLDGTNVTICILDTGVDPAHPAIPDPVAWRDFVNNQSTPYDDHGHGTHVAGIALGRPVSLFASGDAMWHSILASNSTIFNPPVPWANLTYAVNVSSVAGQNISIVLEHLYVLYENYSGLYYFKADATVWVSYDNTTWTKIAQFNGNQTSPVKSKIYVNVPASATTMYLRFAVKYYYQQNASGGYDLSDWDILGWFINSIWINLTATDTPIYQDLVVNTSMPPEVVEAYYWARVEDKFRGMAPNASLAAGKVCGATGCPDSAILEGMNWSLSIGADIVSMSLGGTASTYDPLAQMADYLVDNGVLVVVAAGNSGPAYFNVSTPGISVKALTVGAATKGNTIAWFSSPGPSPVGGWVKPDVSGIGYEVISSITTSASTAPPWAGELPYVSWSGTSMSTPMVAGLAALIKQAHPTWNASLIKQAIIATADWLRNSRFMTYPYDVYKQGAGLIDPHQAVNVTIIPLEANIFLGNHTAGKESYINYTITLLNLGAKDALVTVTSKNLYVLDPVSPGGNATPVTSLLEAPTNGTTIIVPAGGSAKINLTINISDPLLVRTGYYGGHIQFDTNTSGPIKVIFGAFIKSVVVVKGSVVDYMTGAPLEGVNVTAWNTTTLNAIYSAYTDANGTYTLYLPVNTTSVIVTADTEGRAPYYFHVSYNISTRTSPVTYNIYMMPIPTGSVVVLFDEPYPLNYSGINLIASTLETLADKHGLALVHWNTSILGRPLHPLLAGNTVLVIYSSGGTWYALSDWMTREALKILANYTMTTIVLSGGDIGWNLEWVDPNFLKYVAHAIYIDDVAPGDYVTRVYNVTPLSTIFGLENFVSHYGSPANATIGSLNVTRFPSHFPDRVEPVNGSYAAMEWLTLANKSAVVFYGNASQPAMTLYFAFDLYQLDYDNLTSILDRILAWATDTTPPVTGAYQEYTVEGSILTILPPDPANGTGLYDENLLGYRIVLTPASSPSTVLAEIYTESLPVTINLAELGLAENGLYSIHITAWDTLARETTLANASVFRYFPSMTGNILRTIAPGVYTASVKAGYGGIVTLNATGAASLQLVEVPLDSIPPLPPGLVGPGLYTKAIPLDIYVAPINGTGVSEITLRLRLPPGVDTYRLASSVVLWWNGTSWTPVTNYTINETYITIIINTTTSPSITDLTGTPIILVVPLAHIGGELSPTHSQNIMYIIIPLTIILLTVIATRKIK